MYLFDGESIVNNKNQDRMVAIGMLESKRYSEFDILKTFGVPILRDASDDWISYTFLLGKNILTVMTSKDKEKKGAGFLVMPTAAMFVFYFDDLWYFY